MAAIKRRFATIRVSLILCIAAALLAAQGLYLITQHAVDSAMLELLDPRPDSFVFDNDRLVTIYYGETGGRSGSQVTDQARFDRYHTLRTLSPIVINAICLIAAIILYYRVKLQKPLARLQEGIGNITRNNLEFHLESGAGDELGKLCGAFEEMRARLAESYRELWQSQENQRSLYRAFAHDLRTPLTIIKAGNEIIQLVAAKNGDWARALEATALSDSAIRRIERYADQLRELEGLDGWRPAPDPCSLPELAETIRQQTQVLAGKAGKQCTFCFDVEGVASLDRAAALRMLDNLVANSLEHAGQHIQVRMVRAGRTLEIAVLDDGPGFGAEALKKATLPFWSSHKAGGHTGLGLTVTKLLAEASGGGLRTENREQGACATIFLPV